MEGPGRGGGAETPAKKAGKPEGHTSGVLRGLSRRLLRQRRSTHYIVTVRPWVWKEIQDPQSSAQQNLPCLSRESQKKWTCYSTP